MDGFNGKKHSHLEAYVKKCFLGAVFMGVGLSASPVQAASNDVWIYDSIMLLAKEGYMDMPEKPLNAYSKKELGQMVAQACFEFEKKRIEDSNNIKGIVQDESYQTEKKSQTKINDSKINRIRVKAIKDTELYVRCSIQGNNQLEVMKPLKEKSEASLSEWEQASKEYAFGKSSGVEQKQSLVDEYGRISRLMLVDEVQLNLAKEQEDLAKTRYNSVCQKGLLPGIQEQAFREYTQAKSRVEERSKMLSYVCQREQDLLAQLTTSAPYGGNIAPTSVAEAIGRLRAEFLSDLEKNGSLESVNARQQLYSNIPVKKIPDQLLKLYAELRYDVGNSTGDYGNGSRSRVRARLYPNYNIDNNWHAIGMLEWTKTLNGNSSSSDSKLRLARYYLNGNIGVVNSKIGVFSSLMADGNIYDSKFMGICLQAGKPVKYTFEYGKIGIDEMEKTYDFTGSYKDAVYGVDGGFYHADYKDGNRCNIYMGNYYHNIGVMDAGIMLLHGRDKGQSGKNGYVITLGYTPEKSWRPHVYSGWMKYYYQPKSTYISHTMNGMADNMRGYGGFKGWGIGINYNLTTEWTVGLELYRLRDIDFGRPSNTVWFFITRTFQNYED